MSGNHYSSFFEEVQKEFEIKVKGYVHTGIYGEVFSIQVTPRPGQHTCPNCKYGHCHVHEHNPRKIYGGTMNGNPVLYDFDDIRYLCPRCQGTFFEKHECLPWKQRLTVEAEEYIQWSMGSLPFSTIADHIGMSVQSISNRAVKFADSVRKEMLEVHYRYLSMDEVFLGRDENNEHIICWVLNDNSVHWKSNNIMIGIGRTKADVVKRLETLTFLSKVEAVSIDMCQGYLSAIEEAIPNAAVVIDRFHVIKLASELMNQVRKRAGYSSWLKAAFKKDASLFLKSFYTLTYAELETLEHHLGFDRNLEKMYFLFQELLEFFNIRCFDQALEYLCQWESRVIASEVPEAKSLLGTIYNWLPYIMNFFLYRITNGRTEGKNNLLRMIDRMGFHYGIECLQACIYAHDRKQNLVKWRIHQRKIQLKKQQAKDQNGTVNAA
jgi:transposase